MDNDNKVEKNHIHNEVMLFLGDELNQIHQSSVSDAYNLEKEYSKTSKNKSPFPFLVLLGCLVVVLGIACFMNYMISKSNDEIAVSLEEFDDLNLKGLLNSVFKAQENYDNAIKNKADIQSELDTALAEAKSDYENNLFVINSMKLKRKKDKEVKLAQAESDYKMTVTSIHEKYDGKLSAADVAINEYKTQLSSFDSSKLESAKDKENAVDSERKLKQLEIKQLSAKYEDRIKELETKIEEERAKSTAEMRNAIQEISAQYQAEIDALDPVLNDKKAATIVTKSAKKIEEQEKIRWKPVSDEDFDALSYLSQYNIDDESITGVFNNYQLIYDNFMYLDEKVSAIPQKNTIPSYVSANKELVNQMGRTLALQVVSEYEGKVALEEEIVKINEEHSRNNEINAKFMEGLLNGLKATTAVFKINSEEDIQVYVVEWAKELLFDDYPEGRDAQINGSKSIKGKVIKSEDGIYRFIPPLDKDGNPVPIDLGLISVGNTVKIFDIKK